MSRDVAGKIARAVLYEGYLLYPYTLSSLKNQQRWSFGGLYPRSYVDENPGADASEIQSECVLESSLCEKVTVALRFLHLMTKSVERVEHALAGGVEEWEEAIEREVVLENQPLERLIQTPRALDFGFPEISRCEPIHNEEGGQLGWARRSQRSVAGSLELSAVQLEEGLFRLTAKVRNTTAATARERREALPYSLLSTHLVWGCAEGAFVSSIDPPPGRAAAVQSCRSLGSWPVLLDPRLVLSAPVILYDYPKIAPESPGDLFDFGEIDEILSLRILTLTEKEKAEIRAADARGRALLERTESLSQEELLRMHGTWRVDDRKPGAVEIGGVTLRPGSRVRVRPRAAADAFDIILAGMDATVESIDQDFEGRYHVSVSIVGDPGRDLEDKAQLGHRFFFGIDEVEPL